MAKIRIQKVLSEAGIASRRAAEQLILDGRVTLNGRLVMSLPCFVDPQADDIRVDSMTVRKRPERRLYFLLNKPRGVVCTQKDPEGRRRAVDLLPHLRERVYCVGRLEIDGTGLIVLTNDGDLAERMTHPRYGLEKTYVAEVDGRPSNSDLEKLRAGVWLDQRRTRPAKVRMLREAPTRSLLEIRVAEGHNRQISRMLAQLGLKARRLRRTAIGPVTDRGLKIGHFRPLAPEEVERLRQGGSKDRRTGEAT